MTDADCWLPLDLYRNALWLREQREAHCQECVGSIVGAHPRDWSFLHANAAKWNSNEKLALLHKPQVRCDSSAPAGMTITNATWRTITRKADVFCGARAPHHWDDTIHALQNGGSHGNSEKRELEPGWMTNRYPRCVHVGRCGGMNFHVERSKDAAKIARACNVDADLDLFVRIWVAPWNQTLATLPRTVPARPRAGRGAPRKHAAEPAGDTAIDSEAETGWDIAADVAMCRRKYMPGKVDAGNPHGKLMGVAGAETTRKALGPEYVEACTRFLRGEPRSE